VREAVARALAEDVGPLGDLTASLVPAAARATPGLTTVRQSHLEKGRRAAQVLIASLDDAAPATVPEMILPVELVVRGSTAPPRLP